MTTATAPSTSTRLADVLRIVLQDAKEPLTLAKVKTAINKHFPKGTKKNPQPPKPTDSEIESALQDAIHAKQAFEYPPSGKSGKRYWKEAPPPPPPLPPPPSPLEVVTKLVNAKLSRGSGPFTRKELASKPKPMDGDAFAKALDEVIQTLIAQGKLFEHPGVGNTKKYATFAPPVLAWHEKPENAKKVAALVKSVEAILDPRIASLEEIFGVLRSRLGSTTTTPSQTNPVAQPVPVVAPPLPRITILPPPGPSLRTILKQAYDHLCKFAEFRDGLVEIPRLYHEVKKRSTDFTLENVHNELQLMRAEGIIELQVLNEVREAKERDLAIFLNDRLYYYARWK